MGAFTISLGGGLGGRGSVFSAASAASFTLLCAHRANWRMRRWAGSGEERKGRGLKGGEEGSGEERVGKGAAEGRME